MGVGYLGLFDRIDHTSSSEWSSRQGEAITTEQIHHTAGTSDAGARALMDPGGRTVSSNGLLLRDGTLVEVVPGQYRAFTSATGFDRQSLTVETVNQTGSPTWGISETQRRRLAKLNRDMAAAGLPITVGRRGIGGILGHYEVPNTYATACPGPDMQLDHIAELARTMPAGGGYNPLEDIMATADELRAIVRAELDVTENRLRRESRLRLAVNVDTGWMLAYDEESGAKGLYIGPWDAVADSGKADSLRVNYGLVGDTPAEARRLSNQQFANLLGDLGIPGAPGATA